MAESRGVEARPIVVDDHRTVDDFIFSIEIDIGESTDVAAKNPQIITEITAIAQKMHADMGKKMDGPGFLIRRTSACTSPSLTASVIEA